MNIRADSEEIRFRLSHEDVSVLLNDGMVREEITLPIGDIRFLVEFDDQTRVDQRGGQVVFQLAPAIREKFKSQNDFKDPIVTIYHQINGKKIHYKLEVDVFQPKQRERRK